MSLQQAASGAVCPLQACQRWTGWVEGNLPSWHGRSICICICISICICIFLYLLDMVTISIHSLVLPSFDFHLNINVFKAKIQSWKRLNKFWCSGQHGANQRRLQRQLCLQVIYHWTNIIQTSSHYQSITSVTISNNIRREEDEEIFCFASGGFPVESCPAF